MPVPSFAVKKLIPAGSNDPAIIPVGLIFHVDAGNADSLYNYFNGPSGGIESHAFIKKDGTVEWYRDTGREADANLKANSFVSGGKRYGFISIETQGYGAGEWTPAQIESIKKIIVWAHAVHDVPLHVCRNPFDPGIGYHTLFGAPSEWTPVSKSCPGPDRIKQFNAVIVPWLSELANPKPPKPAGPTPAEQVDAVRADLQDAKKDLQAIKKKRPGAKGVQTAIQSVKDALAGLRNKKS